MRHDKSTPWLLGSGLLIVAGSHIYMLALGLPASQMMAHSILNLVAAALIGFAWLRS